MGLGLGFCQLILNPLTFLYTYMHFRWVFHECPCPLNYHSLFYI